MIDRVNVLVVQNLAIVWRHCSQLEHVDETRSKSRQNVLTWETVHGYTPLHSAAMAIDPNAEIAKLLVNSRNGGQWLDAQTDTDWGGNTALHIAATHRNVTKEFIEKFKEAKANSLIRNSQNDTPYHLAAKSINQEAIIYMLNTFSPTNNSWDVDVVDSSNESQRTDKSLTPKDTVINICARNGNAKAVALLIKHGADISQGVLHEVVLESVRNPEKIEKLLGVYQTVVHTAVKWRTLEERIEFLKFKGPNSYTEVFRKTTIWLLTTPLKKYGSKNVIQCALDHGAFAMLWQIVNTKSVFRFDGAEAGKLFDKQNENNVNTVIDKHEDMKKSERHWTVFDVTNFTEETTRPTEPKNSGQKEDTPRKALSSPKCAAVDHANDPHTNEMIPECSGKKQDKAWSEEKHLLAHSASNVKNTQEYIALAASLPSGLNKCMNIRATEPNDVQNSRKSERNFDELSAPSEPYVTSLLLAFDQWRSSNILSTQPLKDLTQPYIVLVQRFYLILGLLQLMFMICFTAFHMPTSCSLARMFNVTNAPCNNSSNSDMTIFNHQPRWTTGLWLIWPIILIAFLTFITFHYIEQETLASRKQSNRIVLKTKDLRPSFRRKLLETLLQLGLPALFCITMFVWLGIYLMCQSYEYYVDITGIVLLLGWIVNVNFFGVVKKDFSIFSLVVSKIILKDIPSFMLFFGFTVVAFTFAMHALRISVCSPSEFMDETFFSVLSSAFGIGEFFEVTRAVATCGSASIRYLFEIVYFLYMCATMIILLNVLIAVLNNRYEWAKWKAEIIWRFQMLSVMRALECHKPLAKVMKKCLMPNRPKGSLFYKSERYNRFYLRLVLPTDEQLVDGTTVKTPISALSKCHPLLS